MYTHIPFDIVVLIIQRLPLKSLIRFISVCKSWKSLIGSSQFIDAYSFHHTRSQRLMISYQVGDWPQLKVKFVSYVDDDTFPQHKFTLNVPPLVRRTKLIGSSHGLLCLTGYFRDDSSTKKMVVLWNPAIRKSIVVVVPNKRHLHSPFHSVVGFGVCPNAKDPKLVKITYINDYKKMESISCIPRQVMVFTLSSREWRCLSSNQLPRKSIKFRHSQTTIGQFIYWLAYDRTNENGGLGKLIMSFDLTTDEFKEIHLPDSLHKRDVTVSRLRESLVLLDYDRNFRTIEQVCVWMMDHGDSKAFTKLFIINAPIKPWVKVRSILGFRKSGEPIIEAKDAIRYPASTLFVYEPCLEDIKDLEICGNKYSFYGTSYTESLLLLDHDDHGQIVRCVDVKR